MEQHETEAALLPNIANQMRSLLSNLYLAASQVIPPEQREQDPALDAKAAILEQSFFRLLRLVNSMSAAEYLSDSQTLSLRDADLVKLVSEVCESSADLAEQLGIQLKFVCAMDRRASRRSGWPICSTAVSSRAIPPLRPMAWVWAFPYAGPSRKSTAGASPWSPPPARAAALWSLCRTGSWAASFPTSPPSTTAASAAHCWGWRTRFPPMRLPCGIWNNR